MSSRTHLYSVGFSRLTNSRGCQSAIVPLFNTLAACFEAVSGFMGFLLILLIWWLSVFYFTKDFFVNYWITQLLNYLCQSLFFSILSKRLKYFKLLTIKKKMVEKKKNIEKTIKRKNWFLFIEKCLIVHFLDFYNWCVPLLCLFCLHFIFIRVFMKPFLT